MKLVVAASVLDLPTGLLPTLGTMLAVGVQGASPCVECRAAYLQFFNAWSRPSAPVPHTLTKMAPQNTRTVPSCNKQTGGSPVLMPPVSSGKLNVVVAIVKPAVAGTPSCIVP